jgi:hypothetical protein
MSDNVLEHLMGSGRNGILTLLLKVGWWDLDGGGCGAAVAAAGPLASSPPPRLQQQGQAAGMSSGQHRELVRGLLAGHWQLPRTRL